MNPDWQRNTYLASVDIQTQFLEDKRGTHTKKFALKTMDGVLQGTVTLLLQLVYSMVGEADRGRVLRVDPRRLREKARRSRRDPLHLQQDARRPASAVPQFGGQ